MKNKNLTYSRINYLLVSLNKRNIKNFLDIELQELLDLNLVDLKEGDILLNNIDGLKINKDGEKFILSYKGLRKIEYFFKDYNFLGSLIIGTIGGVVGGLFTTLV